MVQSPAQFIPPQFIPPQSSTGQGARTESATINNIPGSVETRGESDKSAVRTQAIRTTTALIINSREELAQYLAQSGLDLVTSWVEFEKSKNFVESSYVVYPKNFNANSIIERLVDFLVRYPHLNKPVQVLNLTIARQT